MAHFFALSLATVEKNGVILRAFRPEIPGRRSADCSDEKEENSRWKKTASREVMVPRSKRRGD
jgi:hypothetical protein